MKILPTLVSFLQQNINVQYEKNQLKGKKKMEWIKNMKDEIQRLDNKVEKGEELTYSELYFLHTIEVLSNIFN